MTLHILLTNNYHHVYSSMQHAKCSNPSDSFLDAGTMLSTVESRVKENFTKEEAGRVMYVKWDEIMDEKYKQKVEYLKSLYNQKTELQNFIHEFEFED